MKELHLICNAHLDPVWQWDWNEGATAALATFYSAAELADEYDYIFCHNEALLYEYIEEFDPVLFVRIKELVKKGKWHIMGGWYVQPDCNVPSGEGFVRQIETGLKYFKEKFDYRPTVAVNFDSFGHTQGLVQILKKCGFNGYLFCRPMPEFMALPEMAFRWIGFDGSEVKAVRIEDENIYCSKLGNAVNEIKRKMQPWAKEDIGVALWGVGNHGGGASRKDLSEIVEFQKEMQKEGVQLVHGTPERFIDAIQPKAEWNNALQPVLVKCYSSDSRIKQKYAELESKLLLTEKICVIAQRELGVPYPMQMIEEAQKCMVAIQFHDVLSGTSIRIGEESSFRKADYALELLDKAFTKAFMALMNEYEKVEPNAYPLFVFNPHPYAVDEIIEGEIFMVTPIQSETEGYELTVTKAGVPVDFQIVKEDSNVNFDKRKRVAIRAKLPPMSVTKFDIEAKRGEKFVLDRTPQFACISDMSQVRFNCENACLEKYFVQGKEYLCGNAFMPIVFDDNEDPWGWNMQTVGTNYRVMKPKIVGRIVERGKLYTRWENVYTFGNSEVYLRYKVYTDRVYIDVDVNVVWNEDGKGLKLSIPFANEGAFIGQTAFGTQTYEREREQCAQKFCGIDDGENVLTVYANYIGGCSVEKGILYLTLFNGSVYCAHPIDDLPIVDNQRCNDYIEKGRHSFSFRFAVDKRSELEKNAIQFAQKAYVLNGYPHGNGKVKRDAVITLSNEKVTLSSLRMLENDVCAIRLFNNSPDKIECICRVFGKEIELSFGKYEVKTLYYRESYLREEKLMIQGLS